jgi:hypothetical protein
VPFESDKISRSLFAASESLGRPDAFRARELTGGILHFLAAATEGAIPSTALIADTVIKVVRELGQPALAQAFADFHECRTRGRGREPVAPGPDLAVRFSSYDAPEAVVRSCLRAYGLRAVFSRDLLAARDDGLITLTGLETPFQLGAAEAAVSPGRVVECIEEARRSTGQLLAMDGPEHGLAAAGLAPGDAAAFVRELGIGLRATGLVAIVNLHSATPPAWADALAEGPLFTGHGRSPDPERVRALALALLECLAGPGSAASGVRVDWHLGEADFAPAAESWLLRVARLSQDWPALSFVFDRPKRPVALAEGLDRRHPAALLAVGLNLPCLLEMAGPGAAPDLFLRKLTSLAGLALSAASQKREALRRRAGEDSGLRRGFLLDRARLVAVPVGLESAVRSLVGGGLGEGRSPLELARQIVQRLRDALRQEGPHYQLDTCLDGGWGFRLEENPDGQGPFAARPGELRSVAGLTGWDETLSPKNQLRAAAPLHALTDTGTAAVLVPDQRPLPADEAVALVRYAARQTEVVRLRFVRAGPAQRQLTAPWGEAG